MENATKALVIAGAILVSILLVTMGISLLSNTGALRKQQEQQQNQLNVESFNGRLEASIGNNVTGDKVIALQKTVEAMKRDDPELTLDIKLDSNVGSTIRETSRYVVTTTGTDEAGYITEITVKKLTKSTT